MTRMHRAGTPGIRTWCAALAVGLVLAVTAAAARPFTDAAGRVVEVPDRIARVLAAGPPAAVLLYTLAPAKLAGWVSAPGPGAKPFLLAETRDLPVYGRLTGRGGTANVEAVLAAKPDLIVDVGSTSATYASLADRVQAQTGIPYVLLDGALAKTAQTYRQLGALLGEEPRASVLAAAAERIMSGVAQTVAAVPDEKRPSVYYGRGPKGLETGLAGSINTELIDAAGARNVASDLGVGGLANVSPEQVLAWDPDVILAFDAGLRRTILADPLWGGLTAVREKRVYRTPDLPFGWFDAPPGVNRLIGLVWLSRLLYPNLFAHDLRASVRDFYGTFYQVTPSDAQIDALLDGAVESRP